MSQGASERWQGDEGTSYIPDASRYTAETSTDDDDLNRPVFVDTEIPELEWLFGDRGGK